MYYAIFLYFIKRIGMKMYKFLYDKVPFEADVAGFYDNIAAINKSASDNTLVF